MDQPYDSQTTASISDVRREMQRIAEDQQSQIDALTQRLADTANTVANIDTARNFAGIVNIIDNSLPEWSKDAYDLTGIIPSSPGDGNLECKDWYRQLASDALLSPSSAVTSLIAKKTIETGSDHTHWPTELANADIPRWNKPNAWIEVGGATQLWDIYYPIPNDVVFPGQRFTLQLEAMIDPAVTNALPAGLQFYGGFYDDTAGQQKFITGGDFTITGIIFGIPGSTSVDYQVLARTDSGEEAISNILNFPNAPAVFDVNNHPRITFSGVPGFIEFEIYRRIGTTYVLQFTVRNTIDGTYYDIGNPPEAYVAAFPSVTETAPRAYAITTNFQAGTYFNLGFIRNALTILVPTTYNRSLTGAGMQFLRMGFNKLTATSRQVFIRKIGLSMGDGSWARSANDTGGTHSTPSGSAATGSPAGAGGTSPGVDPPPPVGGGHCVLINTAITLDKGHCQLKDLQKAKAMGKRADAGGPVYRPIKGVRFAHTSHILRIRTDNGLEIGCTDGEPFITGERDTYGTPAAELKQRFDAGMPVSVLTKPHKQIEHAGIISITEEHGDFTVGDPTVHGGLYIGNGFLLHNKPMGDEIVGDAEI